MGEEAHDADDWLEAGEEAVREAESYEQKMKPPGGWDHPADVGYFTTICRGHESWATTPDQADEVIFELAARAHAHGISRRTARKIIHRFAKPHGHSPDMVRAVVDRAYRVIAFPKPGSASLASPPDDEWDVEERPPGWEARWPRPIDYDPKQNNARRADQFLAARPAKIIVSDDVIYSLEDGRVWRELPPEKLAAEIRATDPTLVIDTSHIMGMVAAIKLVRLTDARPFTWIDPPNNAPAPDDLILFKNIILDFRTGESLPHTGQYFATGVPGFDYDPHATCPLWIEKIGEWLDPSFHDTLAEFMGYVLTSDTSLEVLLAMIGVSRGGKGTILHVMRELVGSAHHASITVADLSGDFGLHGVLDKRLLIIPDAHSAPPGQRGAALERIKAITGNDDLSVNRKNKDIITARIHAKIVMAANQHPKWLDESGALAAREVVLMFRNSFKGREDRQLRAKLTAELPGVANWALAGLKRLRSNGGKFTIGAEGRAALRELHESQSPALRFANACLDVTADPDDYVPLDAAYEQYELWTPAEGLSGRECRSKDDFKTDLIAALAARGVVHKQRRWHDPSKPKIGNGKPVRGFFGFRLKGHG